MSAALAGVIVDVDPGVIRWVLEEGICSWGAGRFGAGEPVEDNPVATILLGWGLSWRTGMSRNNSERRTVRLEDAVDVVGVFEGRREGCKLRIGMIGTGGEGRSFDDRRRAVTSSSSKTVFSVRVLTGRKCSAVTFCRGWLDDLGGAGHPSSSALMARPICEVGIEAALVDVPTPGLTTVRPDPRLETPKVLKGDGVTKRGYLGPSREAAGGGGAIGRRAGGAGASSTET